MLTIAIHRAESMLKTRLLRLVGAIACAVVVVGGAEAQTILDQSHVRSTFANGSDAARAEMISQIRAIAPRNRPKWVLSELFNELNRLRRYLDDRLAAIEKGTPLPPEEDHGEYLIDVLSTVCEYDDPSIIGPLLPFIGSGNVLMNKLANFGDLAVPLVAG